MANAIMQEALEDHRQTGARYIEALEDKGIVFAPRGKNDEKIRQLRKKLSKAGATFKNAGASIVYGWQSKACVECTGASGSETFSTTFKCHRDCYFCFNYNVADYDRFVREGCPWRDGLEDAERRYGVRLHQFRRQRICACIRREIYSPRKVLDVYEMLGLMKFDSA